MASTRRFMMLHTYRFKYVVLEYIVLEYIVLRV
ncbi:hypothetical protein LMG33818_002108 [Halomonadaceae bacterium LMG 33818]